MNVKFKIVIAAYLALVLFVGLRVGGNIRAASAKSATERAVATYRDYKALAPSDVRLLYSKLNEQQRREVWQARLNDALSIPTLTKEQSDFIRQVAAHTNRLNFTSFKQSDAVEAEKQTLMTQARKLFTKPQAAFLFASIGTPSVPAFEPARLDMSISCQCSTSEDFCPEKCHYGGYMRNCQGCQCGCGWFWSGYCNGDCGPF